MRTGKIASGVKFRMDKQFENLLIFGISIVLRIEKFWNLKKKFKLENSLISQFGKFQKFPF